MNYIVLRKHRDALEKAVTLDMTSLAHNMNNAGLLPDDIYKNVTDPNSMLSKTQKATDMVTALQTKVDLDPRNLNKFVDILCQKSKLYGEIISMLSPNRQGEWALLCDVV